MDLQNNAIDRATAGGKVATSFIPILGSALGELLGQLIPAQRVDRIVDFIRRLEQKVSALEAAVKDARVKRDVDLIEAALWHVTRAATEERRERIASLVANSLNRAEVEGSADKKLLDLLSDLNDIELLMLQFQAIRYGSEGDAFFERHQDTLFVPAAHMGSSSAEIDREAVQECYQQHLARLSLIKPVFQSSRRSEIPEFDEKTGMIKASGYEITWLGRMVLGASGLDDDLRTQVRREEQG